MKIIVIGAGEVGYHISKFLSREEDIEVVVIDTDRDKLNRINEELDIAVIEGEGGSPRVLAEAGADDADILLAVTNSDEINMIACLVAKALFNVKRRIARIRNEEYFTNQELLSRENLDINPAINPELESARAIIRIIEAPFAYDVEEFEKGLIKVVGFRIREDSYIAGKTLKELRKHIKEPFLIGIIQRGNRAIIPRGDDRIEINDVVYLPIHRDKLDRMAVIIKGEVRQAKNVMLIGGGRIGYHVARELESRGVSLKIVENNIERCKFLTKNLQDSLILHGNGADRGLLEEENAGSMDVFAAITNNEELNIMSSLLAKSMGVKKVITLVNKTEYLPLAHNLGIEVVISPRIITASSILRYVRRGDILSLTAIAEDMAEIIEAGVSSTSSLCNKKISEAEMPKTALIGAIIRGDDIIIPGGDDIVLEKDRLIIFTLYESIKKVEKLLI
ncbi:MAG: Trk system potassium transporter TrkA [Nitrospirae bacterium]|nr:MAG: Trk system potassium transporter TrkA [Nitrospirota bacterium]